MAKAKPTEAPAEQPNPERVVKSILGNDDEPTLEDHFIQWVIENWQQVALVVLAGLLGYYIYDNFRIAGENKRRAAADEFASVRNQYEEYRNLKNELVAKQAAAAKGGDTEKKAVAELETKIADSKHKLDEHLMPMRQMAFPYNRLAALYGGLEARLDGDMNTLRQSVSDLRVFDQFDASAPDRFFAETADLMLARTLIDDDATLAEGRKLLVDLARKGIYVNVSAGMTLSRISSNEADGREALEILNAIAASQPEQASIVKSEIDRLSAAYPKK